MSGKLFVMSAASGAGKTTLKDLVLPKFSQLRYSISCTSRPPRTGEVNGQHYHFKTVEQFKDMIAQDALIEWNLVHGNYYGTPKSFVTETLAQNLSCFFDLDVFGKVNFDKVYPHAIGILVLPPSLEVLEARLRDRATDAEEVIQTRLANARKEMEFAQSQGKYEYTIVNDDLKKAAFELEAIFKKYL